MKKLFGIIMLFFACLAPAACLAEDENHLALDLWGMSHHGNRDKGYNEKNWGLGVRAYHGNWFAAVDDMRNSLRGNTLSVGVGYKQPLFTLGGYTLSVEAELSHLDYHVPKRGVARGFIVLPGAEVRKGPWGASFAYVPPNSNRKSVVMVFGSYYF